MSRKRFPTLYLGLGLLLGASLMASCNKEEKEEVTPAPECALLTFTLNDIKTKKVITLDDGTDSTYVINCPARNYPFTIDQVNNLVYNKDSITYGTQTTEVGVNCTTDPGCKITFKKDGEDVAFSSGDTIDVSQPLVFTIWSTDSKYSRDYLVKVNVFQTNPGESSWHTMNSHPDLASLKPDVSDVVADFLTDHHADHVFAFRYPLKTNASIDRQLVVCYDDNSTDSLACLWTRLSTEETWSEMRPSADNPYGCPLLENMIVTRYDGCLYAFGGKSRGGRKPAVEAFERTFVSVDNGITWRTYSDKLSLPEALLGYDGTFDAAVDEQNFMWIVLEDGTTWRGKLNSL